MVYSKYIALLLIVVGLLVACAPMNENKIETINSLNNMTMNKKMEIEVWSDIMCPFCYIGKRKFESALEDFAHKDKISLVWKSYQLAPDMITEPNKNIHQFLAEHKGMSLDQAKGMNDQVAQMAKQVGLTYNFDKSVVANSFNAHRFAHFAKTHGKQNEAEELLFSAYFTDGKNIDDYATLIALGTSIGLDATALKTALEDGSYADNVRADIYEAHQVGLRGVPFFLFDKRFAVSGAQEKITFLETLERAYEEWRKKNPENTIEIVEGQVCTPEGECK